jgi:hypothetical protein
MTKKLILFPEKMCLRIDYMGPTAKADIESQSENKHAGQRKES